MKETLKKKPRNIEGTQERFEKVRSDLKSVFEMSKFKEFKQRQKLMAKKKARHQEKYRKLLEEEKNKFEALSLKEREILDNIDQLKHGEESKLVSERFYELAQGINEAERGFQTLNLKRRAIKEDIDALLEESQLQTMPSNNFAKKIELFRKLGLQLVRDTSGNISKIQVRNLYTNELMAYAVDERNLTDFAKSHYFTKQLWESLGKE